MTLIERRSWTGTVGRATTMSRSRLQARFGADRARECAEALTAELDVRHPREIDIFDIVESDLFDFDAEVQFEPMNGTVARVVRHGSGVVIKVRESLRETGQRRFAIAHELGHLLLHQGLNQWEVCTSADLVAYNSSGAEPEANVFAATLLMPKPLFAPRCNVIRPDLKVIGELAQEFRTSLTATSRRFVELSTDRCAIVFSRDKRLVWMKRGEHFNGWIRDELDHDSYAFSAFEDGHPPDRLTKMPAEVWIDSARLPDDAELYEHTKWMPRYSSALTFLYIPPDQRW